MINPKVSVIIPNYNHCQFLDRRIDSVLNQTYQNIEVIILDDCSTDNSKNVIERYRSHNKVKQILFNSINSGSTFSQWQKGISLTSGEWIWIAESDDYADDTFLEKMVRSVNCLEGVGLIYCDSNVIDNFNIVSDSFAQIKNLKLKTERWNSEYINNGLNEIKQYILPYGTINNTSAVLFNSKILKSSDIFDYPFKFIGDKYTFIKVLKGTSVKYIPEKLNYYRNPFSGKHINLTIHYAKEQFVIFSWVRHNLKHSTLKFLKAFLLNTEFSLVRDWDKHKWIILRELVKVDFTLFTLFIFYNLIRPFIKDFIRN